VSDVVDGRIRTLTLIVQNVHTIGDRANKVVIDAMEGIIGDDKHGGRARRLRLEHAQIMRPEDLERAARLGSESYCASGTSACADCVSLTRCEPAVIASYQPTHATSDVSSFIVVRDQSPPLLTTSRCGTRNNGWYVVDGSLPLIPQGPERIKGAYAWRTYLK
jgi:hypothetical protein